MELSKQVVSLELAKKMKGLGFKQDGCFYWDEGDGIENRLEFSPNEPLLELFAAYTVAELGEMLPTKFQTEHYNNGDWYCISQNRGFDTHAETEADCRAKMLIYLKTNKLI